MASWRWWRIDDVVPATSEQTPPNLIAGDDGRFRTLRRITAGEELTADYRTFVDEPLPFRPQVLGAGKNKPGSRKRPRR